MSPLNVSHPHSLELQPLQKFRSEVELNCGAFNVEPRGNDTIRGTIRRHVHGSLNLLTIAQTPGAVNRTAKDARTDGHEHFYLICQQSGEAVVEHNGTQERLMPGDLMLADAAKPIHLRMRQPLTRQSVLHLPRFHLTDHVGPQLSGGLRIPREDPISLALLAIIQKTLKAEENASAFYEIFVNLLSAQLRAEQMAQASWHRNDQKVLAEAVAMIRLKYKDPDYNVSRLSEDLGMPLRQLQRAFATFGETPHQRLLTTRLDAARAMITQSTGPKELTTSAVAYAVGFRDVSTFYRQFKARFHDTPSQARRNLQ